MTALDKAIHLLDAYFTLNNGIKHTSKHHKQMGLSRNQYLSESEKLSLKKANPFGSGGIEGFKGKDGRTYKYDTNNNWLVVYNGKSIITFCPCRPKQWEAKYKEKFSSNI